MKRIISKFDLFFALPTLRAQNQPEVVNLCGGIFSILLFSGFVGIFMVNLFSLVKLQEITSTQIINNDRPADQPIGNITVGIGFFPVSTMFNLNINNLRHIIQLSAFVVDRNFNKKQIGVFPCYRQMWDKLDDTKYKTLDLDNHLCIQKDGVEIFGQFGTPSVSFILIVLTKCNPLTSPVPCANSTTISNFFATSMLWHRFIPCSVVILNTGISATKENPYTYQAYQKTLFILFNERQQSFVQTFIGTYQMTTDKSFLPWTDVIKQTGYYVSECILTTIINYLSLPIFIEFYIFPSPENKIINRSYGKFDNILSYVGGLYGIVMSFIGFFILSFNQYKYELRVGEGAFSFEDAHLAKEQDLNFFRYLKYVFFDWIKTLFCIQLSWKDCKAIDQARQQAIQQIDVRHLLKRISHLQKVVSGIVDKQTQCVMYMAQSSSLTDVKRRRNIVQYCHKFAMFQKCPTISTFEHIEAVYAFSMNSVVKTQSSLVYPYNTQNDKSINDQSVLDKVKKQKIQTNEQRSSFAIMQEYVNKYVSKYEINQSTFVLTQQQLQTEEQLINSFYSIQQEKRLQLIRKIPLGILYRMYLQKEKRIKQKQPQLSIIQLSAETRQVRKRKKRRNLSSDFDDFDAKLQLNE